MASASASVLPAAGFIRMPAAQALRPWNRQGQKSRQPAPAGTLVLLPRGAPVRRARPAMHTVQVNVPPHLALPPRIEHPWGLGGAGRIEPAGLASRERRRPKSVHPAS